MEEYEDKKEIFSIPFIAEKPTAGVINVAKNLAEDVNHKLQTQRNIIKNRETEEGKAIAAFSGKRAWICSVERNITPTEVKVSGSLQIGTPGLYSVESGKFISFREWGNNIPVCIFGTKEECVKVYVDNLRAKAQELRKKGQEILAAALKESHQFNNTADEIEAEAKKAEESC